MNTVERRSVGLLRRNPFPRIRQVLTIAWIAACATTGAFASAGGLPDEIAAANALIARVVPGHEKEFSCELIPDDAGRDVFEYEAGSNGAVLLRGNSSSSLAVAFNQYLRREVFLDFDWLAAAPLRRVEPFPAPVIKVRRTCAATERFFLNYCTYGYTMPWWDWAQWERFIDWMAMNGINRSLLQSGQEAVWLRVWEHYGLSSSEIRAYFSAPAHLPWHRMANLDRWGGPLPRWETCIQRLMSCQSNPAGAAWRRTTARIFWIQRIRCSRTFSAGLSRRRRVLSERITSTQPIRSMKWIRRVGSRRTSRA
jgi:hypothetical protein